MSHHWWFTRITQAGSRLQITDQRSSDQPHAFEFTAQLELEQQAALDAVAGHVTLTSI